MKKNKKISKLSLAALVSAQVFLLSSGLEASTSGLKNQEKIIDYTEMKRVITKEFKLYSKKHLAPGSEILFKSNYMEIYDFMNSNPNKVACNFLQTDKVIITKFNGDKIEVTNSRKNILHPEEKKAHCLKEHKDRNWKMGIEEFPEYTLSKALYSQVFLQLDNENVLKIEKTKDSIKYYGESSSGEKTHLTFPLPFKGNFVKNDQITQLDGSLTEGELTVEIKKRSTSEEKVKEVKEKKFDYNDMKRLITEEFKSYSKKYLAPGSEILFKSNYMEIYDFMNSNPNKVACNFLQTDKVIITKFNGDKIEVTNSRKNILHPEEKKAHCLKEHKDRNWKMGIEEFPEYTLSKALYSQVFLQLDNENVLKIEKTKDSIKYYGESSSGEKTHLTFPLPFKGKFMKNDQITQLDGSLTEGELTIEVKRD